MVAIEGVAPGLACWLLAATASTIVNMGAEQVVVTYCFVFLTGAGLYILFDGMTLTARELEVAVLGLAIGSLFPLLGGIRAFSQEWGWSDMQTVINAYMASLRMEGYEDATFGNRGNTAAFIMIIAPLFLWLALDKGRTWFTRLYCGAMLVPVLLNLLVLEVRAAFLTLPLGIALVLGFKAGVQRILYVVVGGAVVIGLLSRFVPDDVVTTISDRMRPVVQVDDAGDNSVYGRIGAMKEGIAIGERNWLLGIGPGAALALHSLTSSHQLFVQQFMETGVLGLVGSIVFACGVFVILLRTFARGQDGGPNNMRFTLIIGPACFILYGIVANDTFNIEYINPWTVLVVSMLALTPRFDNRGHDRAMTKVAAVAGRQVQDGCGQRTTSEDRAGGVRT